MPATIITSDDLLEFKTKLLEEIGQLLDSQSPRVIKKEWLKSTQVMEMLHISAGTLQSFRSNGTLPFTKIGGILFYDAEDIHEILLRNKVNPREDKA
ncbi:Helix-turn-helix domain-containing protein [Maribacter dokdonensis]|uniref:helix-turn-helix domain-containing protein n=1 Tax=Maribacter dokdonensis TaxID=320912 RepID=UPI001B030400|nr:helix-turn-helix domain-containing protein [Maribacter dokdonensis]CAG2532834.1 Helix-turn-helix domain-containing protein [Maribacter dokdonensis]